MMSATATVMATSTARTTTTATTLSTSTPVVTSTATPTTTMTTTTAATTRTTTATFSKIRNGAPGQCIDTCEQEAKVREWSVVCQTESTTCGACQQCVSLETAVCPRGWFSHGGHCYTVHHTQYDYGT